VPTWFAVFLSRGASESINIVRATPALQKMAMKAHLIVKYVSVKNRCRGYQVRSNC
jgi:hypothetical protein